ncbi:MAG: hypothetical protein HYW34_00110, partial [Candidatus Brennerbacteria bacterium]|nr:hypothetical protein [Candidatus Brennerbacteria bacterium]
ELTKEQIKKVREEMDKEINKKKREQSFEYVKSVAEDMKKIEASGKRPDMKVVLSDGSIVEGVFIKLTGNILTILKHGVPDEPLKPEHHKELGSDYSYYYYQVLKPEWDEERKKFIVDILAEDVKDVYFTGMSLMY